LDVIHLAWYITHTRKASTGELLKRRFINFQYTAQRWVE